ncbi:MAG: GNAT family N-acetyltransferase [Betaproteobacteria bacterium]|nr:GNAT family N-acetyltransferase [Betaproteobacteria bacterium]
MTTSAAHPLDNPFWSALTTRQAHFALGGALARRYAPDVSPIAALPAAGPDNVAALRDLVAIGDDAGLVGPHAPALPDDWEILYESTIVQMFRPDPAPLPEGDADVVRLTATDVDEMLALVDLTQPGPFRTRTIELGTYIGIRDGGRLIAMAGERSCTGAFHEVSAVCTHPDARGRGLARGLIGRVVNRMLRAGETPYLHVDCRNPRAIDLYLALGFVRRAEFPLLHAQRAR